MASQTEVMAVWISGQTCYANHKARALYVVNGGEVTLASCGDHVSRAIQQVAKLEDPPVPKVSVWIRP